MKSRIVQSAFRLLHMLARLHRKTSNELGMVVTLLGLLILTLAFAGGWLKWDLQAPDVAAFLSTSVTILATVLAIVVSIALLGFQLVSETFAPSVAREISRLARTWPIVLLFGFFSFGILYNLWLMLLPDQQALRGSGSILLAYSFALTFTCFLDLALFLSWIIRTVSPERLIERFAKQLDKDFAAKLQGMTTSRYRLQEFPLRDNPLGSIEQLTFRAIERGERRLAYSGLLGAYLPAVELTTTENQADVESFFASSVGRLAWKALTSRSPEICGDIIIITGEVVTRLRERGINDRPSAQFFGFSDALRQIGTWALNEGFPTVATELVTILHRLIDVESRNSIPKSDEFFDPKSKDEIGEGQYETRIRERIVWEDFSRGYTRYLADLGTEAVRRSQVELAHHIDFVLGDIARRIADLDYRDRVKHWPFSDCLAAMAGIEIALIDSKLDSYLHSSIQNLWLLKSPYGLTGMRTSFRVYSHAMKSGSHLDVAIWEIGRLATEAADKGFQEIVDTACGELSDAAVQISKGEQLGKTQRLEAIERELNIVVDWLARRSPPLDDEAAKRALGVLSSLER